MSYDVMVVGGGIVGCAVADRLARLDLSVILLERDDDVASYATRANSGIVHAGYDCEPGTAKARFNVRGNAMMWNLAEELDVPCRKCGSLVVAPEEGLEGLKELKRKADSNGVVTEILDREGTLKKEPNVSDNVAYALYAPEAGVISPYQLAIALADRAVLNGAEVVTEAEVTAISRENNLWRAHTPKGMRIEIRNKQISLARTL